MAHANKVAIIMDGNRRWAKKNNLPASSGHRKGIGRAFAEQLSARGHEIIGISRSDGENIRRTVHTASLIENCDVLINNAISMYA